MDQKHFELTGHHHLQAPVQELCGKCSVDPEVEMVINPITGTVHYRRKQKIKKIKVTDDSQQTIVNNEQQLVIETAAIDIVSAGLPEELIDDFIVKVIGQKKKKKKWWKFW